MQGLYKKVLRGHYPKLPSSFSNDLANVIKPMLQVSAHLRPSCGESVGNGRPDIGVTFCLEKSICFIS